MSFDAPANGDYNALSYLFVRSSPKPQDRDLLDALGVASYKRIERTEIWHRSHLVVGQAGDWLVIADYRTPLVEIEESARSLGEHFERVFACELPDQDESFRYSLWSEGACVRSCSVFKYAGTDESTINETGPRFSFETAELASASARDQISTIARELGCVADDDRGTFRVYGGPNYVLDVGPYENMGSSFPREWWERRRVESIQEQLDRGAIWKDPPSADQR